MKIKTLLFLTGIFLLMTSCNTGMNEVAVTYQITDCISGFDVYYRNDRQELIHERIIHQSEEDEWRYSFIAEEGDIVFISAIYDDINSSIKARILIDNKIFRQAFSNNDTANFVVVSGTVPYDD